MHDQRFLIFLPVRNGGPHLEIAIDSVLAQTRADWRLVVLENASTDGTADTLRRYDDPRIGVAPSAGPLGIHANWRRGLEMLDGVADDVLVTFLGHDDYFRPDFLSEMDRLARADPGATLLHAHFDMVDVDGGLIRACKPMPAREDWRELAGALLWQLRDSYGTGYMFRAADYRAVGGIPDLPLLLYSDHLLWMRLARLGHKACSPSTTFAYRLRRGSTSFTLNRAKVNADVEALGRFADLLFAEFAEFAESERGHAAVATLIARELFLFNTPVIRRSMTPANAERLNRLAERFREVARGVPPEDLVGAPASPSRVVLALRRINLTQSFLRQRLRERRR